MSRGWMQRRGTGTDAPGWRLLGKGEMSQRRKCGSASSGCVGQLARGNVRVPMRRSGLMLFARSKKRDWDGNSGSNLAKWMQLFNKKELSAQEFSLLCRHKISPWPHYETTQK